MAGAGVEPGNRSIASGEVEEKARLVKDELDRKVKADQDELDRKVKADQITICC